MFLLNSLLAQAAESTPMWYSLMMPLGIVLIFWFILIRPQMKQQKEHQSLIDNLKKGDRVVTTGGIWGEVDSLDPQTVRLKVNEKTKIVVGRANIAGLQPKPNEKPDQK